MRWGALGLPGGSSTWTFGGSVQCFSLDTLMIDIIVKLVPSTLSAALAAGLVIAVFRFQTTIQTSQNGRLSTSNNVLTCAVTPFV
jgi:hypothetical protein